MNKREFKRHVAAKIRSAFPDCTKKYLGSWRLDGDIERSIGIEVSKPLSGEDTVLDSLINHFDKLMDVFKNTSDKTVRIHHNPLASSEKLTPADQQFECYKATLEFLKIASNRDRNGIRNAFVSFTRTRKQRLVKSSENPDGARRGRPNLYTSEDFRHVVNRASKIMKVKSNRKK